jgi:hypothetical protein
MIRYFIKPADDRRNFVADGAEILTFESFEEAEQGRAELIAKLDVPAGTATTPISSSRTAAATAVFWSGMAGTRTGS